MNQSIPKPDLHLFFSVVQTNPCSAFAFHHYKGTAPPCGYIRGKCSKTKKEL